MDFKITTLVYRWLAGTAPLYLADECTLVTAAGRHRSPDNQHAWSRGHATSLVTPVLAPPGQRYRKDYEQLLQPDITF